MNNLQALESLKQSLVERKTEQERIMNEITQKSLNDLNENLTATFKEKLDSIQSDLDKNLQEIPQHLHKTANKILIESAGELKKFSKAVMILSFILGFMTMVLIYLILLR